MNKFGIGQYPPVVVQLEEIPCRTNPLGVKGIGESGTIGAPPTVINAMLDPAPWTTPSRPTSSGA